MCGLFFFIICLRRNSGRLLPTRPAELSRDLQRYDPRIRHPDGVRVYPKVYPRDSQPLPDAIGRA